MKTAFLLTPILAFSLLPAGIKLPPGNRHVTVSRQHADAVSISTQELPEADPMVDEILLYTNKAREKKGLKPLVMKDALNRIARGHSANMASGKVPFSHDGFKERYGMARKEFTNIYKFAENVSYGPRTGKDVVDGWMKSPHHKENIMGDFTSIGIGVGTDKKGTNYFTQVFCRE